MREILSGAFAGVGNSALVDISDYVRDGFMLVLEGTWGGGTVTLQVSPDLTARVPMLVEADPATAITMSADGAISFTARAAGLGLVLAGGAGPYDINYRIFH